MSAKSPSSGRSHSSAMLCSSRQGVVCSRRHLSRPAAMRRNSGASEIVAAWVTAWVADAFASRSSATRSKKVWTDSAVLLRTCREALESLRSVRK